MEEEREPSGNPDECEAALWVSREVQRGAIPPAQAVKGSPPLPQSTGCPEKID